MPQAVRYAWDPSAGSRGAELEEICAAALQLQGDRDGCTAYQNAEVGLYRNAVVFRFNN